MKIDFFHFESDIRRGKSSEKLSAVKFIYLAYWRFLSFRTSRLKVISEVITENKGKIKSLITFGNQVQCGLNFANFLLTRCKISRIPSSFLMKWSKKWCDCFSFYLLRFIFPFDHKLFRLFVIVPLFSFHFSILNSYISTIVLVFPLFVCQYLSYLWLGEFYSNI